jgi:hypothetical protein
MVGGEIEESIKAVGVADRPKAKKDLLIFAKNAYI